MTNIYTLVVWTSKLSDVLYLIYAGLHYNHVYVLFIRRNL